MINPELFLTALESATPTLLHALLALAEAKGVPLAEVIEEAINRWLTKEFEEWDQDDEDGSL